MSNTKRFIIILHLCVVFSVIVWTLCDPFLGELYTFRQRGMLYQQVMGSEELSERFPESAEVLKENQAQFQALPNTIQEKIIKDYQSMQERDHLSWSSKLWKGIRILLFDLPPFERAWIAFSLAISFMILFGYEPARKATWLIPLIALCYTADNALFGLPPTPTPDAHLFPSEEEILGERSSGTISEQREQLLVGWQNYVEHKWGGEFNFQLERLKVAPPERFHPEPYGTKNSPFTLMLFMSWNLIFGFVLLPRK